MHGYRARSKARRPPQPGPPGTVTEGFRHRPAAGLFRNRLSQGVSDSRSSDSTREKETGKENHPGGKAGHPGKAGREWHLPCPRSASFPSTGRGFTIPPYRLANSRPQRAMRVVMEATPAKARAGKKSGHQGRPPSDAVIGPRACPIGFTTTQDGFPAGSPEDPPAAGRQAPVPGPRPGTAVFPERPRDVPAGSAP